MVSKRNLRTRLQPRGFTLIELVLVIAILGILAVAALPSLLGISLTTARTNAMNATVAAVQSGIAVYGANQLAQGNALAYPASLDPAVTTYPTLASNTTPLFVAVLQNGVNAQWFKKTATLYAYDTPGTGVYSTGSDTCFTYTAATGTFLSATCP